MSHIPSLPSCNVFALRQATRFVSQLYERHLSPAGMTSSQFTLFSVLHQLPGVTMSKLAELLVMDRTSLVRAIQPLARDGYLANAPAAPGSRQQALSLTAAGRQKYLAALPLWEAAQNEYEQLLGEKAAARLRTELMRITQL
ncbi:MAG: MarR family winged helix-turn-helix transcriptional regulator [Pseudomonadota bacterium]